MFETHDELNKMLITILNTCGVEPGTPFQIRIEGAVASPPVQYDVSSKNSQFFPVKFYLIFWYHKSNIVKKISKLSHFFRKMCGKLQNAWIFLGIFMKFPIT